MLVGLDFLLDGLLGLDVFGRFVFRYLFGFLVLQSVALIECDLVLDIARILFDLFRNVELLVLGRLVPIVFGLAVNPLIKGILLVTAIGIFVPIGRKHEVAVLVLHLIGSHNWLVELIDLVLVEELGVDLLEIVLVFPCVLEALLGHLLILGRKGVGLCLLDRLVLFFTGISVVSEGIIHDRICLGLGGGGLRDLVDDRHVHRLVVLSILGLIGCGLLGHGDGRRRIDAVGGLLHRRGLDLGNDMRDLIDGPRLGLRFLGGQLFDLLRSGLRSATEVQNRLGLRHGKRTLLVFDCTGLGHHAERTDDVDAVAQAASGVDGKLVGLLLFGLLLDGSGRIGDGLLLDSRLALDGGLAIDDLKDRRCSGILDRLFDIERGHLNGLSCESGHLALLVGRNGNIRYGSELIGGVRGILFEGGGVALLLVGDLGHRMLHTLGHELGVHALLLGHVLAERHVVGELARAAIGRHRVHNAQQGGKGRLVAHGAGRIRQHVAVAQNGNGVEQRDQRHEDGEHPQHDLGRIGEREQAQHHDDDGN